MNSNHPYITFFLSRLCRSPFKSLKSPKNPISSCSAPSISMESPITLKSILGSLLIFSLLVVSSETQSSNSVTVYEMLEKFNFPKGILPEGVQNYSLRTDGGFDVYLSGVCEFKVPGNYLLRYKKKISGKVQFGSLKNLNGVSVKILFLWFGISEVDRSGDDLRFYVGPFSSSFSVSSFGLSPQCRGGFSALQRLILDS
ncbi:hypothetical protein AXF42_Ash000402 [Apostasia shenzhenica]|uniref:Uncharacterized protein n=1 Tax=Apostasia shenzhenica TaxID=1088818 RepID=A0A2I0AGA5_9ASPA|nr:hypothetical protein AXF42_Ash000402 [Apostasia shenzhenica]